MKIAIFFGIFFLFVTAAQAIDLPAILELASQNKSKSSTSPSLSTLINKLSPPHLKSASRSFGVIRIPLPDVAENMSSQLKYAYAIYLANAAGKVIHASFLKGFQETNPTEICINFDKNRFFLITSSTGNSPLIIIDTQDFSQQFIAPLEKTPPMAFQGGALCSSTACQSISAASNSIRYFRNLENLTQKPIAYRAAVLLLGLF